MYEHGREMTTLRKWFDRFTEQTGETPESIIFEPAISEDVLPWSDVPGAILDKQFSDSYGGNESPNLCAWSKSWVIFSDDYDGHYCGSERGGLAMGDRELAAILLSHGQSIEAQTRAWVAAIAPAERVEKLTQAYISCRKREESLEKTAAAVVAMRSTLRDLEAVLRAGGYEGGFPTTPKEA